MPINNIKNEEKPIIKICFLVNILSWYNLNNTTQITVKMPDGLEKITINASIEIFKTLCFM